MFGPLYQIAKNTFRENLREPIFLLVLLSALVLIGILPAFTLFVFREQVKLVVDSSLAAMLLFGWVLAVLCATHAINQEIRVGTAVLVLAKPVNRPVFILGKIVGILAGLSVFCFLAAIATLVAVRVAKDQFYFDQKGFAAYFAGIALSCVIGGVCNYVKRSSFPMATIGAMVAVFPACALVIRALPVEGKTLGYSWGIVPALILVIYAVWAMGILATALSTRFDLVPNMLICSFVFVLGLMSDYLLGRYAAGNWLAAFFYAVIPNWQLFWMADALAADKPIPVSYVLWGALYILLFIGFFLVLAVWLFQDREVGKQDTI
jgi:ABC-type transport system involved in multi-copper enzyme maturation permease subunit